MSYFLRFIKKIKNFFCSLLCAHHKILLFVFCQIKKQKLTSESLSRLDPPPTILIKKNTNLKMSEKDKDTKKEKRRRKVRPNKKPQEIKIIRNITSVKASTSSLPNYSVLSPDQKRFKLRQFSDIFKKMHEKHGLDMVELKGDEDLYEVHQMCDSYTREIHIKKLVDTYKLYYITSIASVQLLGKYSGKFDLTSLVKSQYESLDTYEEYFYLIAETKIGASGPPSPLYDLAVAASISVGIFILKKVAGSLGGPAAETAVGFVEQTIKNKTQARTPQKSNNDNQAVHVMPQVPQANMQGMLTGMLNTAVGFMQ